MSDCDVSSSYGGTIELNEAIGINFYAPTTPATPPSPSNRRVQLSWAVSAYNFNGTDGVRVRIEAVNAEEMPAKIFAYLLMPMRPGAGAREGAFSHVCSPTDLVEFPEDDPIPGHRPEWFRLNYVDVHLRSRSEAKQLIQDVIDDVNSLKATLDTMDTLIPGGTIWVGGQPNPDVSSSEAVP
jgi:hypothetical protein